MPLRLPMPSLVPPCALTAVWTVFLAQIAESGPVDPPHLDGADIEKGIKDIIMSFQSQHTTPIFSAFIKTGSRSITTPEPTSTPVDGPAAIPPSGLLSPYQPDRYQPPPEEEQTSNKLVNLFFLLIALGIILAFAAVYFYRRRRTPKKHRALQGEQIALGRDPEAGGCRVRELGRSGRVGCSDGGEEGLNERGEAPPPYTRTAQGGLGAQLGAEGYPLQGAGEGYVLPRLPERALTPRGIAATHQEEQDGLPTYEGVASIPPPHGEDTGREVVIRTMEVAEAHPPTETGLQAEHVTPPSQDRTTVST